MKIKLAVFRLLALVAMGVCMAMLLDYLLPSPAFCGFKAYVADPATDREIDRRVEWLDEKTCPGLPVIWIENQELVGAQTLASLHAAWQRAERQ